MTLEERQALREAAKTIAEHASDERFERWCRIVELSIAAASCNAESELGYDQHRLLLSELAVARGALAHPLGPGVVELSERGYRPANVTPQLHTQIVEKLRDEITALRMRAARVARQFRGCNPGHYDYAADAVEKYVLWDEPFPPGFGE